MSSDSPLYTLDLAINSSEQPAIPGQPIIMTYGFAQYAIGGDEPQGQRTDTIPINATFQLNIAETAPNPGTLTQIVISVYNENQTDPPSLPTNPFGWPSSTRTIPPDENLPQRVSSMYNVGCNVLVNAGWVTKSYTASAGGTYIIEVAVLVIPNGATVAQAFFVDPRMIVGSGNR
jgi:hypothetical protein